MPQLFALLFIILCSHCTAQLPAEIRFTYYTRANGLPEKNINNITQDSRGYLWLGSREGLIRFDGLNFKTWYANTEDTSKFKSNNINVSAECPPGLILFTSGNELWQMNIYNQQLKKISRFSGYTRITTPKRLSTDRWFISTADSVFITDNNFVVEYSLPGNDLFPSGGLADCFPLHFPWSLLFVPGNNNICLLNYVSKKITALYLDDRKLDSRAKFYTPQVYDSIRHRLYLSAYFNGNFYCDLQIPQVSHYQLTPFDQPDGAIRKSHLLPDGKLIQAGEFGLYILKDGEKISYKGNHIAGNSLAQESVLDIYKSREGLLWLATTNGISSFSLDIPAVRYWQPGYDNTIKSIIRGKDNNIYWLSEENSLHRHNKKTGLSARLDSTIFYSWAAAENGNQITVTGGGKMILTYDELTGRTSYPGFLHPFFTTSTDLVTLVFKASNGDNWYSCNGSAGIIRNPAGTTEFIQYSRLSDPPAFSHSYVHTAAEDSRGNIWWGSNKFSQLLKWDAASKKFEEKNLNQLLPQYKASNGINNLFVDQKDNLWIAVDAAGLIKYNLLSQKGEYYDINKGLPADEVTCMTSDAKQRLWVGTRKGLGCYLPEGNKIITFTTYDGLPEDNFEGRGILYDKGDNLLYIGGKKTIAFFNPDSLLNKTTIQQPHVFIDAMTVNGKPFYFDNEKSISLRPEENNIEFSFAAVDFTRNNQLEFQYRLSGTSNEWIETGDNRRVSFNNLAAGSYRLSVRCKYKGTDTWKETGYPISFIVQAPWYKTGWFRVLLTLFILALTWLFVQSHYRRKMEKQKMLMEKELAIEQERTRMARELHDGLGSMLSGIKHSFSAMKNEIELNDIQELKFHANIDKLNESISELRNISHSMASESLLKYGLENSLRDYCRNLDQPGQLEISFEAIGTEKMRLDEEQSFHLFRIVQELVQNITKHSGATKAIIQLSYNNQRLYLTVEDNGSGFDMKKEAVKKGMGLKNIESRVKMLKGIIDYRTHASEGTSVLVEIPCTEN